MSWTRRRHHRRDGGIESEGSCDDPLLVVLSARWGRGRPYRGPRSVFCYRGRLYLTLYPSYYSSYGVPE